MQQCIYSHICITNWVKKIGKRRTKNQCVTGRKTLFDVTMEVKVKFLCEGEKQNLYKSSPNAVGYELFSTECFELLHNEIRKLPTGVILELPDSLFVQVAKKSSINLCGLRVLAGIIDPDYRAQIFVVLHNITNQKVGCKQGNLLNFLKNTVLDLSSPENQCFLYSVAAGMLQPAAKNAGRASQYKTLVENFNMNGILLPMTLDSIQLFEEQNDVSINC